MLNLMFHLFTIKTFTSQQHMLFTSTFNHEWNWRVFVNTYLSIHRDEENQLFIVPPPFFFYPKTSYVFLSGYILHDIYYSASNQTHNRMVRMCITIVYLADETNDRNILHNKNKEFSSSIYSGNNKLLRW